MNWRAGAGVEGQPWSRLAAPRTCSSCSSSSARGATAPCTRRGIDPAARSSPSRSSRSPERTRRAWRTSGVRSRCCGSASTRTWCDTSAASRAPSTSGSSWSTAAGGASATSSARPTGPCARLRSRTSAARRSRDSCTSTPSSRCTGTSSAATSYSPRAAASSSPTSASPLSSRGR